MKYLGLMVVGLLVITVLILWAAVARPIDSDTRKFEDEEQMQFLAKHQKK